MFPDLLRRLDKMRVGQVRVACRRVVAPVPEQLPDQQQASLDKSKKSASALKLAGDQTRGTPW